MPKRNETGTAAKATKNSGWSASPADVEISLLTRSNPIAGRAAMPAAITGQASLRVAPVPRGASGGRAS